MPLPFWGRLGLNVISHGNFLTNQSGFARKPSPGAKYAFARQYELDPRTTYYLGDWTLM